jgi:hypothetical protein
MNAENSEYNLESVESVVCLIANRWLLVAKIAKSALDWNLLGRLKERNEHTEIRNWKETRRGRDERRRR